MPYIKTETGGHVSINRTGELKGVDKMEMYRLVGEPGIWKGIVKRHFLIMRI